MKYRWTKTEQIRLVMYMKITDVQKQKKTSGRYSVFIDGEFAFGVSETDMIFYKLYPDTELTEERLEYITTELLYEKAKEKAFRKLDYRSCTKKEIYDKLKDDYSEDIIQRVLNMLEKYGYINDEDYASRYISDCLKLKGWGKKKIFYNLKFKGIPDEISERAYNNIDFDPAEKAASLLEKKFGSESFDNMDIKKKAYNYLMQRGYEYEEITTAVEICKNRERGECI